MLDTTSDAKRRSQKDSQPNTARANITRCPRRSGRDGLRQPPRLRSEPRCTDTDLAQARRLRETQRTIGDNPHVWDTAQHQVNPWKYGRKRTGIWGEAITSCASNLLDNHREAVMAGFTTTAEELTKESSGRRFPTMDAAPLHHFVKGDIFLAQT